jgi:hypothetical protein
MATRKIASQKVPDVQRSNREPLWMSFGRGIELGGANGFDYAVLIAEGEEVWHAHAKSILLPGSNFGDHDEASRIAMWQPLSLQLFKSAENRSIRANTQREGRDGDQGESRIPDENPPRQAGIFPRLGHRT